MTIHFLTPDPIPLTIAISAEAEVCTITPFSPGYALLFSSSRFTEIVVTGFPADVHFTPSSLPLVFFTHPHLLRIQNT